MASNAPSDGPARGAQPEALRRLLSARALLTAFLLSLTRDLELAEGIFQDLCVAVTEGREELDPDAAGFDARLRALARRRAFAVLRARGIDASGLPPERLVDRVEAIVAELSATPAERWTRRKDALRECLHALPAHLRQVVDLRYVQNLSVGQIAARLGHESQHVHAALERARRHLSECLRRRAAAAEEGA